MNILGYIRDKFGSSVSKVTLEDENGNTVTEKELKQRHSQALKDTIEKSIETIESETSLFDESIMELGLKIQACEEVLTKGENKDVAFNKTKFIEKKDALVKGFIEKIVELKKAIDEAEEELNKAWEEKVTNKILKASDHQKEKVKKTMDEWKEGSLKSGSGDKVTDQKQAIAIALSQAGLSKKKKKNKDKLKKSEEEIEKGGVGSGRKRIFVNQEGKEIHITTKNNRQHFVTHSTDPSYSKEDELNSVQELRDKKYSEKKEEPKLKLNNLSDYKVKSMDTGNTPGKETPEGKNGKATTIASATNKDNIQKAAGSNSPTINKPIVVDINNPEQDFSGNYANVIVRSSKYWNKILFLKRGTEKAKAPGQWCLPGGSIDAGETPVQAASRELKEESNLGIQPESLWGRGKIKCEDGKWAYYFEGSTKEEGSLLALLDGENMQAAWCSKDEWQKLDLIYDLKDHLAGLMPEANVDLQEIKLKK